MLKKPHKGADRNWEKDDRPARDKKDRSQRSRQDGPPSEGMERYRIAVGHDHGVMPGNIVGAIANEADIEGRNIGRINIYDDYTLIDLPAGLPKETFNALKNVWVAGQKLNISRLGDKNSAKTGDKPIRNKRKGPARSKDQPKRKTRKKPRKKKPDNRDRN